MVAALPGHIRLKLDQTLAQWRQWDCEPRLARAPVIERVLGGGLSNHSVVVACEQRFVVRIDGINPAAHSLNRQGEWRSLLAAHRAGLAPRPRYVNPELGTLVCDYLEPDTPQRLAIEDIGQLLRNIHRLPGRHQRLDLGERILAYEKRLAHRDEARAALLVPCRQGVMRALAATKTEPQAAVLCHNDLLAANRLYSGGTLYALDWEYSAMGSPWYDLAVVAAGDELDASAVAVLLATYLGRPASRQESRRVAHYGSVYRYIELLWYLAQEHPALDDALLRHKRELLESNLPRE